MKRLAFILTALLSLVLFAGACASSTPALTPTQTSTVREYADPMTENLLQAINQNDYAKFTANFDETMKNSITQEAFGTLKTQLQSRIGDYVSKEFVSTQNQSGFTVVIYSAKFTIETEPVVLTMSFHEVGGQQQIGGFYLNSPRLRQ